MKEAARKSPTLNTREAAADQSSARIDSAAVTLLALAVRLTWLKFGSWESGDSQWYIATARNVALNHFFSADGIHPTAYRPPLYSVLIAALWLGDSAPVFSVLIIQAVLGSFTVTLTYLIARRHGGRTVALLAGIGMALAPMTGRFTAVILSETLFTFLLTLGIFWWSRKHYALTGVAFGFGMLTRVTLLPFVLLLPLLTLAVPWRAHRRAYLTIALLSLVVASAWMVRNAVVFHRFIPIAASGYGTNLLIGSLQVEEADDVARRKALLRSVDTAAGVSTDDETEFDRVRLRAALKRISEHPLQWFVARIQQYPRLFIDSGSYLFGADGIALRSAIREGRLGQVLLRSVLIIANLLVFVLALLGMIARRSQFVSLSEVTLFPIFLVVVMLPLWIEPRYGLPMMPSVAILSAIAAVEIWRLIRQGGITKTWRRG